jgi:hypothetical protein
MTHETVFTMDTSSIKYGQGVTREVGHDMRALGATRVMVLTDPRLSASEPVSITIEALRAAEGLKRCSSIGVRVEPTDASFLDAIDASPWRAGSTATSPSAVDRPSTRPRPRTCTRRYPATLLDLRQPADRRGTSGAGSV